MSVEDTVHYESQEEKTDTCFQHALNAYFQKTYLSDSFRNTYFRLLADHASQIESLIAENCKQSFFGSNDDPNIIDLLENDEDLQGYQELYSFINVASMIEDLQSNEIKQLSPFDALFLLEFKYLQETESLEYNPHRLYHRYARSQDTEYINKITNYWVDELNNTNQQAKSIYFARIENNKSHAFAAIRNPNFDATGITNGNNPKNQNNENDEKEKKQCKRPEPIIILVSILAILTITFILLLVLFEELIGGMIVGILVGIMTLVVCLYAVYSGGKNASNMNEILRLKKDKQWILLDSLKQRIIFVDNTINLITNTDYGGNASVMIITDSSRKSKSKSISISNIK